MQTELDFNNHLALKIQRYWRERGHAVEVEIHDAEVDTSTVETNELHGRVLAIRSNLKAGLPHG